MGASSFFTGFAAGFGLTVFLGAGFVTYPYSGYSDICGFFPPPIGRSSKLLACLTERGR